MLVIAKIAFFLDFLNQDLIIFNVMIFTSHSFLTVLNMAYIFFFYKNLSNKKRMLIFAVVLLHNSTFASAKVTTYGDRQGR